MTFDLKLSKLGDLELDAQGRATLIGGAEQIAQQIRLTLSIFLGEWFLDISFGVPYFENILGKGRTKSEIEAIVRKKVRDVPGVVTVGEVVIEMKAKERSVGIQLNDIKTNEGLIKGITITQKGGTQ